MNPSPMNTAIVSRLADVTLLCERLKAAVEADKPGAMLLTFPLMRLGIDADAMANVLQGHVERLSPPTCAPVLSERTR
jgi:hypothetical protein